MPDKLKVTLGFASHSGIKPDNEDFHGVTVPDEPQLTYKGIVAAIADGMSGSEAGKQASQCCVVSFLDDYYSTPDSWTVKLAGQRVLSATNSWLYGQSQRRYQNSSGLVSTLSIVVLKSTTAHIFHIGDSRIYRLRRGNLEQITRDHRVWLSQDKNYLSRAMGIEPRLEVDFKTLPVESGDLFVMTTDGVHDFLDDKALKQHLTTPTDLNETAEDIIRRAMDNGSDDNLTCQILRVESLPDVGEDEIMRRHANVPFPPPLRAGMILDGYRIEAELHASKRTHIYRAIDTETNEVVILKAPSLLYEDDTHFIEHFLHEEWAGKRINHDHVVKVLGTNRHKSRIYYVTEFLDGQTLRSWMDANPKADIKQCQALVEQIAKGLRAFHRKEMLHQDLKPENIMIDRKGHIKIIDFGSVKIAGITEVAHRNSGSEENVFGTLNYTAPEYHLGQRGSEKSDMYSLAVIAYEMLNAALPYGHSTPDNARPGYFAKLRYVPSVHHNPLVPAWLDGALKKAVSITPQLRYDDLSEFLFDLHHPNPRFMRNEDNIPLLQRNPLRFWQGVSCLLLVVNLLLAFFLVR